MRPKYRSMPVVLCTRAIGLDNHLLATNIIPPVRVPIAVDDHLLEQPIGSSSSPRDSDSDSGLTIRADSALRLSRDEGAECI